MSVIGIIAEFNPLHLGHKLLIDSAKQKQNTVVCVISSNFVQRGDTAILSKQKRAEAALRCGADLVAELPVFWSMSTAQNFAIGGVSQLAALGCEEIWFGSECGDMNQLQQAAELLEHEDFSEEIAKELSKGITFAAARERAAKALGFPGTVFSTANDTLGIEYISAARRLGLDLKFRCIKRVGAGHDSPELNSTFVSASLLREKILTGNIGFADRFVPVEVRGLLKTDNISDIKKIETAILAVLRTKTKQQLQNLPDISEGIENKLYFSIRVATSLEELYNMIKTKRYTMARVRRLVLSAFLGIDSTQFLKSPPYVRVLGFNSSGAELLSTVKPPIPVITRAAQLKQLDSNAQKVFETECRATDLYALSLSRPQECGQEFKVKLLKTESLT